MKLGTDKGGVGRQAMLGCAGPLAENKQKRIESKQLEGTKNIGKVTKLRSCDVKYMLVFFQRIRTFNLKGYDVIHHYYQQMSQSSITKQCKNHLAQHHN